MKSLLARQFRKPEGVLGSIISRLMAVGNRGAYAGIVKIMDLRGGESIFEIGYGPGDGIRTILSSTDCSFRGMDFSPLMHSRAVKRNHTYVESGRAVFECGDFLDFKPGKAKYDRVFFINVIYFWKDIRKPIRKIYGMLSKGGLICFYMADGADLEKSGITATDVFNKHALPAVKKELMAAGFGKVKVVSEKHNAFRGHFISAVKQ